MGSRRVDLVGLISRGPCFLPLPKAPTVACTTNKLLEFEHHASDHPSSFPAALCRAAHLPGKEQPVQRPIIVCIRVSAEVRNDIGRVILFGGVMPSSPTRIGIC